MFESVMFGLNHIACPNLNFTQLVGLAKSLGMKSIEVRNDLREDALPFGECSGQQAAAICKQNDMTIAALNAFQRFNAPGDMVERMRSLQDLFVQTMDAGIQAVILCPVNDRNDTRDAESAYTDTVRALQSFGPIFEKFHIKGLVEPLGFSISSLSSKALVVNAMEESGYGHVYALVHDTFHHFLAGEEELFPHQTGLVHISGIEERLPKQLITDDHRVLVGEHDYSGAKQQVQALLASGYQGIMSFEPFSPSIQKMEFEDLKKALRSSLEYLS